MLGVDETEDTHLDKDLKRIAARIRSWRDDAGFTLQQLGDRAGVSASTIHKIENLQTVPTIAVLLKVANGLNRRPSELLAEVDVANQVAVVRRGDRQNFEVKQRATLEHLIGMIPRNRLDLWRVDLAPGKGAGYGGEAWQFNGEMVLCCDAGILQCEVSGESFELGPGDTIHFDTSMPHRWVAGRDQPASVTVFVLLPERMQGDLMARLAAAAADGPVDGQSVEQGGETSIHARTGGAD
jgi:transcriptional regulator with XRE-family HTH domain